MRSIPQRSTSRRLWHGLEPIHAVTYFAPACLESLTDTGLVGFWMGYFAGRAAPLGPVGPAVIEATFYNFPPSKVRRAIPDAWTRATPAAVLAARADGAAVALRHADPRIDEVVSRLVPMLEPAVRAARCGGRPLAAANRDLALPEDPVARLWQLTTTLREHRGDGHVAALVTNDVDGCEAHVLLAAAERYPASLFIASRGWSTDEWAAATDRLRARGLVEPDDGGDAGDGGSARLDGSARSEGSEEAEVSEVSEPTPRLTLDGQSLRAVIEDQTDRGAMQPYRDGLTDAGLDLLLSLAAAAGRSVISSGVLVFPNPIGLPEVLAPPPR